MSAYNYKNMLPVYLESTLKSRLADEPDDSEMLGIIEQPDDFLCLFV